MNEKKIISRVMDAMAIRLATSLLLLLLQRTECLRGSAASQTSSLTLVAENPGAGDWSLGDTVRLSYVLETQADTHVTCTRDSRLVSAYLFTVPTRTITVRARRLLLVRNASVENAGRYLCRARSGNASRAVGWRVRVRTRDQCPSVLPCQEAQGRPCTPCSCPQGRAFFGKSRAFTCYETPRGHLGNDLKMAVNVSRRLYTFEQFEPVVVEYELRAYGDTQVTWLVDNVVYHTHTVLVPQKSTGLVSFSKRFVLDPSPKAARHVELTVEAQLRHTDLRVSESVTAVMSRSVLWSSCKEENCSAINAHCAPSGRCECAEGWTESRGVCRLHCHSNPDCQELGKTTVCKDHECECGRGHVLKHKRCMPLECFNHKMCTDMHGAFSSCHQGRCWCLAGHVMTNGRCDPVDCLDDSECTEENTRCIGRHCRCASDFDLVENKCRKSKVGECNLDVPCPRNHSTCLHEEGECFCAPGYRAVFALSSAERTCLRVSCAIDSDCTAASAVARCQRGLCVCPDDRPAESGFCLLPHDSRTVAQGLWGVTKMVTYCVGLVIGVVAFAAVSITLLKAKASAGYAPSPGEDDDAVGKQMGDEGAIMAEAVRMRNRRGGPSDLEATREIEVEESELDCDLADYFEEEERRMDRMFVRSLFPKLSDGLFLASHGGSRTSSSGGIEDTSPRTTVHT
ncbi:uncharacterized protein LOC119406269 [Rhipicephalus sanguineus]|uniref:uncharacterized protein LOC119406269 n=1 Tax=Rhipicephalus sanguineus TaxID=34632 RepID=UPI0018960B4C|nr:uncharacterized protein LOC119406269 [Rhipicephalus sanguineus]